MRIPDVDQVGHTAKSVSRAARDQTKFNKNLRGPIDEKFAMLLALLVFIVKDKDKDAPIKESLVKHSFQVCCTSTLMVS